MTRPDGSPSASTEFSLLIDGRHVVTTGQLEVVEPATGKVFANAPKAEAGHVDEAVSAARAAFPDWAARPWEERAGLLGRIADEVDERADLIASLVGREQGKTAAAAHGEVGAAAGWLRATAAERLDVAVLEERTDRHVEVRHRPLGVVASVTPWNFPFMIPIWHVAPALLAGNTVVFKPSEHTPLTGLLFAEVVGSVVPDGVMNAISGNGEIGALLVQHEDVDKVVFTGSTATGKAIAAGSGANLTRLTLELGGNDAAIILPGTDLTQHADAIFARTFGNSGQVCAAIKRIYVHESQHDELVAQLARIAATKSIGPTDDPTSDYGPVQNSQQFKRLRELAVDAEQQGGRFVTGGPPTSTHGFYVPITIVTGVSNGVRLVDEEQFGPIVPVVAYSEVDDAERMANDSMNGLGGSVWGSDIKEASLIAARLDVGTSWVNDHGALDPSTPFGGAKQSGIGVAFGRAGLESYTQRHVIVRPHEAV